VTKYLAPHRHTLEDCRRNVVEADVEADAPTGPPYFAEDMGTGWNRGPTHSGQFLHAHDWQPWSEIWNGEGCRICHVRKLR
jgi:hypothetical protein